jgi:hypothetical protein
VGNELTGSAASRTIDGRISDKASIAESAGDSDAVLKPISDVDVSRCRRERTIGRDQA